MILIEILVFVPLSFIVFDKMYDKDMLGDHSSFGSYVRGLF